MLESDLMILVGNSLDEKEVSFFMGKKLNNVSISISDSFMIKFKIGD